MQSVPTPSASARSKRRSARVQLKIQLVIEVSDSSVLNAETVTVSKHGARIRITSSRGHLAHGEKVRVTVRRGKDSKAARVVWLDKRSDQESWNVPEVGCGLPQASREHPFQRVDALATDPKRNLILAGSKSGVHRSLDGGKKYYLSSRKTFLDKVTLPPNWLFCSGQHEIEVVTESEASTD